MRKVQVSDKAVILVLSPSEAEYLLHWLNSANLAADNLGGFRPMRKALRNKIEQQLGA